MSTTGTSHVLEGRGGEGRGLLQCGGSVGVGGGLLLAGHQVNVVVTVHVHARPLLEKIVLILLYVDGPHSSVDVRFSSGHAWH